MLRKNRNPKTLIPITKIFVCIMPSIVLLLYYFGDLDISSGVALMYASFLIFSIVSFIIKIDNEKKGFIGSQMMMDLILAVIATMIITHLIIIF